MTLLEDRSTDSPPASQRPVVDFAPSRMSTWRFALRLARRETRRRPGRTLLVMLLVALPVFAMSVAVITGRSTNNAADETFTRRFGSSDIAAFELDPQFAEGAGSSGAAIRSQVDFPDGTSIEQHLLIHTPIRARGVDGLIESKYVELTDIDLRAPIGSGVLEVRSGRAPQATGEVAFDANTAGALGVGVGDSVEILRPFMTLEVVGIVRSNSYFNDTLMVVGDFDVELLRANQRYTRMLIDLPDGTSRVDQFAIESQLSDIGVSLESRLWEYGDEDIRTEALAWGWIAGVVAFVAVGIVIAAAFATSARRQLATIGQLSANGAPQRLVRRSLGLQGMWTGVLGAALGIAVAIVAALLGRSLIERSVNHRVSGVEIRPLDLIVIALTAIVAATAAALVPARSASKIPVLAALAGRRPLSNPPRWLVPTGVALFGGGLLLLAAAASTEDSGDLIAAIALLGGLAVLFGLVCTSPLIVAMVGAAGSRASGTIRLAARSLARTRTRSAAVMTAIATVMAIGTAGLTAVGMARVDGDLRSEFDDLRTVEISYLVDQEGAYIRNQIETAEANGQIITDSTYRVPVDFDPDPVVASDLPADLEGNLRTILPDADFIPIESVVDDQSPFGEREREQGAVLQGRSLVVATDLVLDRIDLDADEADRLATDGIVALAPWVGSGGSVNTADGRVAVSFEPLAEPGDANGDGSARSRIAEVLLTRELIDDLGFDTTIARYLIENPSDLTDDQLSALDRIRSGFSGNDPFVGSASAPGIEPPASFETGGWFVSVNYWGGEIDWNLVALIGGVAVLLLVLLVVAIGLSLAATESRGERDVLHSIGAPPHVLRRVAAAKAYVLTLGAAVVAVPTGFVVVRVVAAVNDQKVPTPFVSIVGLVVVVPTVAAIATFVSSAVAQRFRPVTISTLSTD